MSNADSEMCRTIAFESDDFQYQINHFPGVPGQGTRNSKALSLLSFPSLSFTPFHSPNTHHSDICLQRERLTRKRAVQSPQYNLQYAKSISALAPYLSQIQTSDVVAVLGLCKALFCFFPFSLPFLLPSTQFHSPRLPITKISVYNEKC